MLIQRGGGGGGGVFMCVCVCVCARTRACVLFALRLLEFPLEEIIYYITTDYDCQLE